MVPNRTRIEDLLDYLRFLSANNERVRSAYQDLLIMVPALFRDPDCFEFLTRPTKVDLAQECRSSDRGFEETVPGSHPDRNVSVYRAG
jgi:chemotaxis methyl-accepting protein methylase